MKFTADLSLLSLITGASLIVQLVLGLQQSGMMTLGKLVNPMTRKIEIHLDAARDTIDTLAALLDRQPRRLRELQHQRGEPLHVHQAPLDGHHAPLLRRHPSSPRAA